MDKRLRELDSEAEQSGFDPLSALLLQKEGEDFVLGFETGNYWTTQLACCDDLAVERFNALDHGQKRRFVARMDSAYPGMVFHYLMQARQASPDRPQWAEFLLWWARAGAQELGEMVAPSRAKLIGSLLSDARRVALFLMEKGYGPKELGLRFARACAFGGWDGFFADWESAQLALAADCGGADGGQKRI